MKGVFDYPVVSHEGLCAWPLETPIRRLLLCNGHQLPALGVEGDFVAGWSVARLIAKTDKKKEWMRRGLWTKGEI